MNAFYFGHEKTVCTRTLFCLVQIKTSNFNLSCVFDSFYRPDAKSVEQYRTSTLRCKCNFTAHRNECLTVTDITQGNILRNKPVEKNMEKTKQRKKHCMALNTGKLISRLMCCSSVNYIGSTTTLALNSTSIQAVGSHSPPVCTRQLTQTRANATSV